MSVKGSRLAPNLLFRRRAPRATPRTSPAFSVMQSTILSASASLYVCSTTACVSTIPIFVQCPEESLPGHKVEEPGQYKAYADEFKKDFEAVANAPLFPLATHHSEDQCDEG